MKAKKAIAILMSLALIAGMIPAAILTLAPTAQAYGNYTKTYATEYHYDSGTQFIWQLGLYYSSSSDADAEQHIIDAGFEPFGNDFNAGAGGKYVHGGYKATTDPAQAIKALRIWHASNDPTDTTSFIGSGVCGFYQVGSGAHMVTPAVMDGMVGLNKGNGGDNLELFATPDHDAGPAVTALSMVHNDDAATAQEVLLNFGYTIAVSFQDINAPQDLNQGAGSGTDYNYIGYKSDCTVVDSDPLRAAYQSAKACSERGSGTTALTNALNAADAILADLNDGYTVYTQAQIDSVIGSLTAALPENVHVYADYPAPSGAEYAYTAGTQFISQIAISCSAAGTETATQDLQQRGFTPFGTSFNNGTSGYYVRAGYKTSTDPVQAIKALRIWKNGSAPDVAASPINDSNAYFYQVGSGASAQVPAAFGQVSLNQGNSGDDLRLFVTADPAAGLPVTEFAMNQLANMIAQYGYTIVDSFHSPGTYQTLNDGAGGSYLFLGYRSSGFTAVDSSTLRNAYAAARQNYERMGYTWFAAALDAAAAILDDLKDGYTTYTQTQIDAAADTLSSVPTEFIVILDTGTDTTRPQVQRVEGSVTIRSSNMGAIAASREEAQPLQFYIESDGNIGFYLPNNYLPGNFYVNDGDEFDGWMIQHDSSDNPEYVTLTRAETVFIAKAKKAAPTAKAPRVPEAITLTQEQPQTSFDIIVDSCVDMRYDPVDGGRYVFDEQCLNFRTTLYDGVLTRSDGGATLAYTMTTTGARAERTSSSVFFGVPISSSPPYSCSGVINIDADAFADAAPGTYTGSLHWTWVDGNPFNSVSGEGDIPLTLTVADPEQPSVNYVVKLESIDDGGNGFLIRFPTQTFVFSDSTVAETPEAAGNCQFYYNTDGSVGFHLRNDYLPGGEYGENCYIENGYEFVGWRFRDDNSDNPEYFTLTQEETALYAKAARPAPPAQQPEVPASITITYGDTQTAFDFRVEACAGMEHPEPASSIYVFGEHCNFSTSMFDDVLTNAATGATIPYQMTSNGFGAGREKYYFTGEELVTFSIDGRPPSISQCFINIDADAMAEAIPGVYTGNLYWTWHDAENSGEGYIPLTLTVPGLSAEEQAPVDAAIALINAIGTVEYSTESQAKISAARSAYNALSVRQKTQVSNYETLTAAEATYEMLSMPFVGAHSLTLDGTIGVNFYAYIPDVTDAANATFTVDGKTVTVPIDLTKFIEQDGLTLYKFSCNVAAPQIDTEITGVIYNGENESAPFAYTVQTYLTEAQQTMADNAAFMALAGSLTTYGYYANALFGFNPDFTQHALFDNSGFANVTAASLADHEAQITNKADGVNYVGSSLVLRSETAIRHYFTLPAGATPADYTILLGEGNAAIELTPQANGKYYYVEIPDIPSAELGDTQTVRVIDSIGNAVNAWTYSALSYVYKALTLFEANDPAVSDALANVTKALTLYYQAADAYFTQLHA